MIHKNKDKYISKKINQKDQCILKDTTNPYFEYKTIIKMIKFLFIKKENINIKMK